MSCITISPKCLSGLLPHITGEVDLDTPKPDIYRRSPCDLRLTLRCVGILVQKAVIYIACVFLAVASGKVSASVHQSTPASLSGPWSRQAI